MYSLVAFYLPIIHIILLWWDYCCFPYWKMFDIISSIGVIILLVEPQHFNKMFESLIIIYHEYINKLLFMGAKSSKPKKPHNANVFKRNDWLKSELRKLQRDHDQVNRNLQNISNQIRSRQENRRIRNGDT